MKNVFEIQGLKKERGGGRYVLQIPELAIEEGKTCAVVGPNGAGKTTLLRLLNGLETFDAGSVLFAGQDISTPAGRLSLRRRCTLVMHPPALFSTTIGRNAAFAARSRGARGKALKQEVRAALRDVNMDGWQRRHAARLSAGEQKRVSIARALAFRPDVICIDEPVADLDPQNTELIEEILREIRRKGITLIFTTLRRKRSFGLADEIIYLENGKLVEYRLDNLFKAGFSQREGAYVARLGEDVEIAVPPNDRREGRVHIDPAAIILSPSPLTSSARNSLQGKVTGVEETGGQIRVTIDAGAGFVTLITPKSMKELKIRPGAETYVTFKVSSVKIY